MNAVNTLHSVYTGYTSYAHNLLLFLSTVNIFLSYIPEYFMNKEL